MRGGSTFSGDFQEADSTTATNFATNVEAANNEDLALTKGVVFKINESSSSYAGMSYTIKNFVMKTTMNGDILQGEGSFRMEAKLGNLSSAADVKFYHDGTYLAMDITEQGVRSKQKSVLPLLNICNLFHKSDLVDGSLGQLNRFVAEIIGSMGESTEGCLIDDGEEFKKVKVGTTSQYIIIVYDVNYKLVGVQYTEGKTVMSAEVNNEPISLPDFSEFTNR